MIFEASDKSAKPLPPGLIGAGSGTLSDATPGAFQPWDKRGDCHKIKAANHLQQGHQRQQ